MTAYRFYQQEQERFKEYADIHVADDDVKNFAYKLLRHFKISARPTIKIREQRGAYAHWGYNCAISLPHNPSVLLIVHEVAHYKVKKHTKKMSTFIARELHYAEKKNYFNMRIIKQDEYKQMQTEKHEAEKQRSVAAKRLTVFYECLSCKYVEHLNLTDAYRGHMTWAKEYYKVGNILKNWHCNGCGKTVDKQSVALIRMTREESKAYEATLNAHYKYPLVCIIIQTRAITKR
jgi:hypothetical protein